MMTRAHACRLTRTRGMGRASRGRHPEPPNEFADTTSWYLQSSFSILASKTKPYNDLIHLLRTLHEGRMLS